MLAAPSPSSQTHWCRCSKHTLCCWLSCMNRSNKMVVLHAEDAGMLHQIIVARRATTAPLPAVLTTPQARFLCRTSGVWLTTMMRLSLSNVRPAPHEVQATCASCCAWWRYSILRQQHTWKFNRGSRTAVVVVQWLAKACYRT